MNFDLDNKKIFKNFLFNWKYGFNMNNIFSIFWRTSERTKKKNSFSKYIYFS